MLINVNVLLFWTENVFLGANILRGMAGAGVLAGFDKFKEFYISMRAGN